jgi:Protein of unknown function (DUF2934)
MARRSTATLEPAQHASGSLIAERAYYKAERRGFTPGHELDDWLAAEREVTNLLAASEPAPATQAAKKTPRRKNGVVAAAKRG